MSTYVVTGGASGIGAATVELLREQDHRVITVDILDADVTADLASLEGRAAAVEALLGATPDGLDGLVLCAGVGSHMADRELIASLNYFGSVELVQGLRPTLEAGAGAVVLISSNSAPMVTDPGLVEAMLNGDEARAREVAQGCNGHAVYSGSKLALAHWMRRNSSDYVAAGVRMNAVAPGHTETPMTEAIEADPEYGELIRAFVDSIPIGHPGRPIDIAHLISFLLSPQAGYICGAVIFIDGGHDAMLRPELFQTE